MDYHLGISGNYTHSTGHQEWKSRDHSIQEWGIQEITNPFKAKRKAFKNNNPL